MLLGIFLTEITEVINKRIEQAGKISLLITNKIDAKTTRIDKPANNHFCHQQIEIISTNAIKKQSEYTNKHLIVCSCVSKYLIFFS